MTAFFAVNGYVVEIKARCIRRSGSRKNDGEFYAGGNAFGAYNIFIRYVVSAFLCKNRVVLPGGSLIG